ncbi:uncharacterized protein LOC144169268 [Haemaphysalis longicornis]
MDAVERQAGPDIPGHYPWRWSLVRLLRGLDANRKCSAGTSSECWLIEDLDLWNRALHAVAVGLKEVEPGKLCLTSYEYNLGPYFSGGGHESDGSFLIAWLPRQHKCIQEVQVLAPVHVERLSHAASFIVGPAPNLRRLVVRPRYGLQPECRLLDAFGPPQHLRELEVCNLQIRDSLAAKVAAVLRANAATLATVKLVGNQLSLESAITLLLGVVVCDGLTELSLEDSVRSSACDALAEAFRSTRVIRKVTLVGPGRAGTACKHWSSGAPRRVCLQCLTQIFEALQSNCSLRHLTLQFTTIGRTLGEALAHFLTKHPFLETLEIKNCSIDRAGAEELAGALSQNCPVESLNLKGSEVSGGIVKELCSAAKSNQRLKKLVLPDVVGPMHDIRPEPGLLEALQEEPRAEFQMSLHLMEAGLRSQAGGLLSLASDVNLCQFGPATGALRSVCNKLASNGALRSLAVQYVGGGLGAEVDELGQALCPALEEIRGLRNFQLDLSVFHADTDVSGPVAEIFKALASLPCLRQVSLTVRRLSRALAQLLETLVVKRRRSLVALHLNSWEAIPRASIAMLRDLLSRNSFLCEVTISCSAQEVSPMGAAVEEATEQNLALLNRASRFVRSVAAGTAPSTVDRRWASAFEEVNDTGSLEEHIARLTNKPQAEVRADIKKAMWSMAQHFLIYAGVVQSTLSCAEGSSRLQLDSLNDDILCRIFSFLKLTDVFG